MTDLPVNDSSPPGGSKAVTVVICSFNGRTRVGEVLEALTRQTSSDFSVILVDNNSTDGTADHVRSHPSTSLLKEQGIPVQVCHESRQGLSYARHRGVLEAHSPLICFLDDDNIPAPNYIAIGMSFFERHPVALAASRIHPRWAASPPRAIHQRRHLLAINDHLYGRDVFWPPATFLPPTIGAGLWFRRVAYARAIGTSAENLIADRTGGSMVGGGDIEIGHRFSAAGFTSALAYDLEVEHDIPPGRLETPYFVRLITGVVRSEETLQRKYAGSYSLARRRVSALLQLVGATLGAPLLLTRKDPLREILFVIASRWARLRGPYPLTLRADQVRQDRGLEPLIPGRETGSKRG